ncbi:PREDICTED: uncharacterized protein LOC106106981 [Papilio polytes]|uniref:uncharacterized protein LOC106106981 n=1 Tax=Papilio polytes TaxID=76194 RepID=UPI0006762250|nr:PREDICTED: uncharacterized protein LOC106106981 [Papilio polytes]
MSRINRPGKKNALLQRKEKLLEELRLCDKQIEEAKQNQTNNNLKYEDSSDSDTEISLHIEKGKSLPSLVRKKSALQTRCNATAELTGLEVLESTVNILTESPELNGEPPVTEEGVWHEVIAECKVDLIPFTISFYVHQPNRSFGQPFYRCLQIVASKQANERELTNSVLSKMITPSDAFEVLKSYAATYRSRRSTLARLAEMYGDDLFMTPLSEGGYQLQCANVLELSWTLESKPSTVAYFRHRMKLSLEYMDETSLKIITQANKEMSNPSVDTEERTLLLSKIISTCLKAQEGTSGSEPSKVQKRPNDGDLPVPKKNKTNEVMGPPTAFPKKSKIKGKENNDNRSSNKTADKPKKSNENHKDTNVLEKARNSKVKDPTKVSNKDNKNMKKPTKESNEEVVNKTKDKLNKATMKPDLVDNSKNKLQKTDKTNVPNKENIEKPKKDEETKQKGKKLPEKNSTNKENVTKIEEIKNSQETKNINKEMPQTKRINLKPSIKKNEINKHSDIKSSNTEIIKPINKRFNNINKEKILQTKIPMKMNAYRMSPRTNVKNVTSSASLQKINKTTNIARLVKKPSGKKIL